MDKKKASLFIACIILSVRVFSQQVQVEGAFVGDSVKLGEEISYSLTAKYPRDLEVIFPDSTFDFSPFEFYHLSFFQTRTDSLLSFDSVVYDLATFEIDSVQYLQLPVFVKQLDDSTNVYADRDSITLFHVIEVLPDSLNLKENTSFIRIPGKFNYPLFLIFIGVILLIILISLVFFGKQITRAITVFRMKRIHKNFVKRFYEKIGGLKGQRIGLEPEEVLNDWKKYMERLEKEPYTKMTSRELIQLHADQRLKENLRSIDRYIYGGIQERPVYENFERLMEYSIERYDIRIKEVTDG